MAFHAISHIMFQFGRTLGSCYFDDFEYIILLNLLQEDMHLVVTLLQSQRHSQRICRFAIVLTFFLLSTVKVVYARIMPT